MNAGIIRPRVIYEVSDVGLAEFIAAYDAVNFPQDGFIAVVKRFGLNDRRDVTRN